MFRCSAKCCDDPKMSIAENQTCTEDCAKKILKIQQLVQDEFVNFQVNQFQITLRLFFLIVFFN